MYPSLAPPPQAIIGASTKLSITALVKRSWTPPPVSSIRAPRSFSSPLVRLIPQILLTSSDADSNHLQTRSGSTSRPPGRPSTSKSPSRIRSLRQTSEPPFFAYRTTGLLKLTASEFENLQSLFFVIGGVQYELTPNAQIWPRELNSVLGGSEGNIYLVVSDLGTESGQGLDFISTCFTLLYFA